MHLRTRFAAVGMLVLFVALLARAANGAGIENGVVGDPQVDCMEDRVRLTFRTEKPFNGRIFVKGMIENDKCVQKFVTAKSGPSVDFEVANGDCNMRRSRKISPEERGVEQSITIIISFHDTFITKVDRAYRCTCFYMEADRVVTNRFDVSALPTTDLIDTAKMPVCTYTVHRESVNGPLVSFATVGETLFHVWKCESDMFSMLVHSCFVDDGNGNDKKPLIDEHGCTIDEIIVPDLSYNHAANLAYTEVSAFKFADKVTTYFQCAVSTCMISEGMCQGKTPPRCNGGNSGLFAGLKRARRAALPLRLLHTVHNASDDAATADGFDYTMDLSADKIVVFDLDDAKTGGGGSAAQHGQELLRAREAAATAAVCLSQGNVLALLVLLTVVVGAISTCIAFLAVRRRAKL